MTRSLSEKAEHTEVTSDDSTIHERPASNDVDRKSQMSEKKNEIDEKEGVVSDDTKEPIIGDFPDGGLRAWLVVAGVSLQCIWVHASRSYQCVSTYQGIFRNVCYFWLCQCLGGK